MFIAEMVGDDCLLGWVLMEFYESSSFHWPVFQYCRNMLIVKVRLFYIEYMSGDDKSTWIYILFKIHTYPSR